MATQKKPNWLLQAGLVGEGAERDVKSGPRIFLT